MKNYICLLAKEENKRINFGGSAVSHWATFFLPPNDQTCAGVIVMDRVARNALTNDHSPAQSFIFVAVNVKVW